MGGRWRLLAALGVAGAVLAGALLVVPVRGDLLLLLPPGRNEASRLMLRELAEGPATRVVLAAVEGAPTERLAALSRGLAAALAGDARFALVENGGRTPGREAFAALFAHRYLLAPADPGRFEAASLRRDFERLLDALQGSASPLVEEYGLPDPTGAFPALLEAWRGGSAVNRQGGVWMGDSPPRAMLVLKLADGAAPAEALKAVQGTFAGISGDGPARLVLAGPAVVTAHTQAAIAADTRWVSVVSLLGVAGLLVWRFRSPFVLAALAVPVVVGVAVAVLATGLRFGFVHAITLGFGMTMLGVTADYPVLLVGHRKLGETAAGTLARIGPTFAVAVLTAAIGVSGMAFAGVPAVAQFGTFALAGLLGAAAATRFLLPRLIVAAGLAPVGAGDPRLLRRVERWRRWRPAALAVAAVALLAVVVVPPRGEADLGRLAGLPPADLALDAELRRALGVPEPGQVAAVRGDSAEAVLQAEEALLPVLDRLRAEGVVGGAELAAGLLPSAATQRARQAGLPDAATLPARIEAARAGLPFTADAFEPFAAAVEASRALPPMTSADIADPLLRARLDVLLARPGGEFVGLVAFRDVRDPARLAAALGDRPGVVFLDVGAETRALAAAATRAAGRVLTVSAGVAVASLLVALRDPWRVARVCGAVAAALLLTVAVLSAAGVRWSLVHLAALQLVAGVGLDYALFFSRPQVDEEERARTLRTLVTCCAMALLTFGLLALCRTPLLSGIGVTVAVGVASALGFAFLLAGPKSRP